jgi:hypothetical protein
MSTESEEKAAADKVVAAAMAAIGDTGGDSVDSSSNNDNDNRVNEADNKAHKRKERLEQNRISARESRKRKKTMIEELQRTVITLSKENKDLNDRNEHLRQQLMEIGTKVCICCIILCCVVLRIQCGLTSHPTTTTTPHPTRRWTDPARLLVPQCSVLAKSHDTLVIFHGRCSRRCSATTAATNGHGLLSSTATANGCGSSSGCSSCCYLGDAFATTARVNKTILTKQNNNSNSTFSKPNQ